MTTPDERIAALTKRLEDGFIKIGEAMVDGMNTREWERVWIDLLREYERLNDEIAAVQSGPVVQASMALGRLEAA